jgi:hypothetical protein
MSSILYTIGLLKSVVKTSETINGEIIFRLNDIEFDNLDFKIFQSSSNPFPELIKGYIYSFVGSFCIDDGKTKVSLIGNIF